MNGKLIFLGTGSSTGVPLIGCQCAVCHSHNPHNQRLRPSALLQIDQKQFLIDIGPDFRQQALKYGITSLDGMILTHSHHDHVAGLDDVRALYFKRETPIPILLSQETATDIQRRFDYMFFPNPYLQGNRSKLELQILPEKQEIVEFEGLTIQYVDYEQGRMKVNGFRFGSLAYLTDIKNFKETIYSTMMNVKVLIISALRTVSSPLHFSIDEAIKFAARIKAQKVWITHISHDLDHDKINDTLPEHVRLAYDGLTIDFG